jgi:hypothetical protein
VAEGERQLTLDLDTWSATRADSHRPVVDLSGIDSETPARDRRRHAALVVLLIVILAAFLAARADRVSESAEVSADWSAVFATTDPHPLLPASTAATRGHRWQLAAYTAGGSTYLSQVPRHR